MQRKLLIIACLLGTVFIAFGQSDKKKKKDTVHESATADTVKINYKELGAPMPRLKVIQFKGRPAVKEVLTTKDFSNNANLFVMMYNPTCGHCQEETILLEKNIHLFKKSQILLLASPQMESYMDFFDNTTKVSEYPSIKVALDSCGFIDKTFTYSGLPQINIYDKDRKLVKIFSNDTPLDSLKPFIE